MITFSVCMHKSFIFNIALIRIYYNWILHTLKMFKMYKISYANAVYLNLLLKFRKYSLGEWNGYAWSHPWGCSFIPTQYSRLCKSYCTAFKRRYVLFLEFFILIITKKVLMHFGGNIFCKHGNIL